jgi:RND family efflux transporter MFP subunit
MTYVSRTIAIAAATAAAVLLVLGGSGCSKKQENAASAPIAVRTAMPERRDMHAAIEYLGSIHSDTEIQINAQLQGSISAIGFEEGESIRKGAQLLRLSVPDLEASAERLRGEREYWCRRSEADERLLEQRAIGSDQVDAGRRACAAAEAAYKEAAARLDKAVEHAPISGIVLRRFVERGQNVMPGQPLLLVGGTEKIVQVNVVEEDLARGLRVGMNARIVVDAATDIPARVVEIAAQTATYSRSFTVKLRPEEPGRLEPRHGASVSVLFLLEEKKNTLAVPLQALADREGDAAVFLVRGDRVRRQRVRTGIEDDGWVEVAFDWNGTDAVATSNHGSLSDSVRVLAVPRKEERR